MATATRYQLEKSQQLLHELEGDLYRRPNSMDTIWRLPSNLFTYQSKARLAAAVDFHSKLKKAAGIRTVCSIVVGSVPHGESTDSSDLDILPVYDDRGFSSEDHSRVIAAINNLNGMLVEEYGFEISPKPLPKSMLERVVDAGCDSPPYFVLGRKSDFYRIYNNRGRF